MPNNFHVRPVGDLDVLAPLLAQLRDAGAIEAPTDPSLVLVGATTVLEAELVLLNLSPKLRRRTVVVGVDDGLDLRMTPGSHAAMLEQMMVLGSLQADCASSPTLTSFVGARGSGDGLPGLVGASFWKLGPAFHKVWRNLPDVDAGEFLVRLVTAIEVEGVWFDDPPLRVKTYF